MSGDVIRLQNLADTAQKVFSDDGKMIIIPPYGVEAFRESVARLFLKECGKHVQVFRETVFEPMPGEPNVWIANVTGNPFLPKEAPDVEYDPLRKKEIEIRIPNPNKRPRTVKRVKIGTEVDVSGGHGPHGIERVSNPPKIVAIPPHTRMVCPRPIAKWLIDKDAAQERKFQGSLIECRAPTAFEPNITWPLHEVALYSHIVDKDKFPLKPAEYRAMRDGEKLTGDKDVDELKKEYLYKVFFLLVDDKYALPHENAFLSIQKRFDGKLKEDGKT
jgi:hypothetical protein